MRELFTLAEIQVKMEAFLDTFSRDMTPQYSHLIAPIIWSLKAFDCLEPEFFAKAQEVLDKQQTPFTSQVLLSQLSLDGYSAYKYDQILKRHSAQFNKKMHGVDIDQ